MSATASRGHLLRLIHVGKRQLGMDDETYKSFLQSVTEKESCSALTGAQLTMVLQHMRRLGFVQKQASAPAVDDDAPDQLRKIFALWSELYKAGAVHNCGRAAARAYVERITGKAPADCDAAELSKVIETLKSWYDRL